MLGEIGLEAGGGRGLQALNIDDEIVDELLNETIFEIQKV
jgi:hypothetical protein